MLGSPITIDGAFGEGGGALLRTALTMSALTQQPLRIDNIRGATNYPGLDLEDLSLIKALTRCCAAELVGAEKGSTSLSFLPTRRAQGFSGTITNGVPPGERSFSIPTLFNALLPVLARGGVFCTLDGSGETHGQHVLSYDMFANATMYIYKKLGIYAFPELVRAGFGRTSKGLLCMEVEPSTIQPIEWRSRGELIGCRAVLCGSGLSTTVLQRGAKHLSMLAQNAKLPLEIDVTEVSSDQSGCFLTLYAIFERGCGGATAMGAKGVRIESLAQSAFADLLSWLESNATLDPYLADQVLVAASLAEGESTFTLSRLTKRFLTMVTLIKQFTPIHLTVIGSEDGPGTVTIRR